MPSKSIKTNLNGMGLGKLNDAELRSLFTTILTDLAALRTSLTAVQADGNNVQIIANNLVSAVGNLRATVNNLVLDIVKVNCNTNSANNTVVITATAVTTNLNAITMANSAPSALNLTA